MRKSQNRLLKDQNNILSDVFLEVCRGGKTIVVQLSRQKSKHFIMN